jgi:hypothetical protein
MPNPSFSSRDELRDLYHELAYGQVGGTSNTPVPYYKSVLKVFFPKKQMDWRVETYEREFPAEPRAKSDRGEIRAAVSRRFVEFTRGLLYNPQVTTQPRAYSSEWALTFKVDCDLSLRKYGSLDPAIDAYLGDRSALAGFRNARPPAPEPEEPRDPDKNLGGRPRKYSNAQDLLERYGTKTKDGTWKITDESTLWILAHGSILNDDESFTHDEYRDPVTANVVGGLEDLAIEDEPTLLHFGNDREGGGE